MGKPCNGKHKMNLDELKALSRQIKPYRHHVDCTTTDINSLVKKLKSNMNKAKSRMLQQLKLSNSPIYQSILCEQQQQQEEEDDSSSVSTSCTYQDLYQSLLSLYPTTSCLNNMTTTTTTQNLVSEVTEDQINTWLQRGGFSSSPLTMATDQELAGKLIYSVSFFSIYSLSCLDLLHFDEL